MRFCLLRAPAETSVISLVMARVLLSAEAVYHRRIEEARDIRRNDLGEHLLGRGFKSDVRQRRAALKLSALQRQEPCGVYAHLHAVFKVRINHIELGDLPAVKKVEELCRDLAGAAQRGALRGVLKVLFHRYTVACKKLPAVVAHHENAAVGMAFDPPQRFLNDILVVSARKAAVRRDDQIGVCAGLIGIVRIAAEHIGASDLAPALENALDLPRQRVKKRARFFKIFLRPPHFGRGDEVHRVRHLLRAFDAFNVSADLLHARHVLSPHLLNFENFL